MDFFTKQDVQLNDNNLFTAATQNDEDQILLLMSQRNYFYEEISHIIQIKTISFSSKLCILYGAIKNDDFALINIILNYPIILSHLHYYKNNAIFKLIKSQANFSFYQEKYTLLTKKLAIIPGVANEIAKQYIADFYVSSEDDRIKKVNSLKCLIAPLNSTDKNTVLLHAVIHNQLEVITILLEHYDNEIDYMNKLKALFHAKIKKNTDFIAYLEKNIQQSLIILPKKILSFLSILKSQGGFLLDYNKFPQTFINMPFIKAKHNPNLEHSIIQGSNGALFALYRKGMIGEGAYGKIKLAQNIQTGQICVVKIEKKTNVNISKSTSLEIEILKMCDLFLDYQENKNLLKDQIKGYIFIQYIPGCTLGDLSQILGVLDIKLSTLEQCQLLQSLLKSLKKLKENNINHHDLHPSNVMINPHAMRATIIDFGKSCIASDRDISIELSRINSTLCHIISDTKLKEILNDLLSLRKKNRVLKSLDKAIDAVNSLLQQYLLLDADKLFSPFAALIEKDLTVVAQLEKLNMPISESKPLLFFNTNLQKKCKRESNAQSNLSFHQNEITDEASSAEEPKIKKACYQQKK